MQPKKQHNSLQNRKIAFFHTDIYRGPDSSLCHKAYQKHKQLNLYVNCGPHKHHCNKQYTVQYVPTKYLEVPQFTGCLNTYIICTHCGTVLRTSSSVTPNYADSNGDTGTRGNSQLSHAAPRHIRTAYNTSTETTFIISAARDSYNVPSGRFNLQFHLRHGSPNRGRHPQ